MSDFSEEYPPNCFSNSEILRCPANPDLTILDEGREHKQQKSCKSHNL